MASSLGEFDPNRDLPKDFMMIVYGKRRTGKTTMTLHMLDQMKERFINHKVHVFSGTADVNPSQWKAFPECAVHGDIGTMNEKIEEMLETQRKDILAEVKRQMMGENPEDPENHGKLNVANIPYQEKLNQKQGGEKRSKKRKVGVFFEHRVDKKAKVIANGTRGRLREKQNAMKPTYVVEGGDESSEDEPEHLSEDKVWQAFRNGEYDKSTMPHHLVILDDVVDDNSVRYSKALNRLAVAGRHWFFTVILLSQCICGSGSVPPIIRINADCIICVYNPRSKQERTLLSTQYLSPGSADPKEGLKLLADITRVPFRNIVIDVTNTTATAYNQFLYTYGPVPEPPRNVSKDFRMGTDKQWEEQSHRQRAPKFLKDRDGTKKKEDIGLQIDAGKFHELYPLDNDTDTKYFRCVF